MIALYTLGIHFHQFHEDVPAFLIVLKKFLYMLCKLAYK